MNQSSTTFDKTQTALLNQSMPLPIKYLQQAGASAGQVVTFNGTDVEWETPSITPGDIALANANVLIGGVDNLAHPQAVTGILSITNAGVTSIPTPAAGDILVGSLAPGNPVAAVAMSGDVAIDSTGATTIQPKAITTAKVLDGAITGAKLATGEGYFSVTVISNGTAPVNVLGLTVPVGLVITGITTVSADATGVAITVAQTAGTVATITTPASAGGMIGAASLANTGVLSGSTLTVTGGAAHNAFVTINFQVA